MPNNIGGNIARWRLPPSGGKILQTDEMQQSFAKQNMLKPPIKTVEQFNATVRSDIDLWQKLAKDVNLKVD